MIGHTWSLSLEEQFYLVWPLLLYGMLRLGLSRRQIVLVVIGGIFASALLRLGMRHQHQIFDLPKVDSFQMYAGLDTRADCPLVGCLTALLAAWNYLPSSKRFLITIKLASPLAVAGLAFCLWRYDAYSSQYYDGMFTGAALMAAVVIVRLLAAPSGIFVATLELSPLVVAGRISYGLYLFHVLFMLWLGDQGLGWRYPLNTAIVAVLSFAAAFLSFYLIERPFLRLKDRLSSTKPAPPTAVHPAAPRVAA